MNPTSRIFRTTFKLTLKLTLLGAALAMAVFFLPGRAAAVNVCGDDICQGTGIPPETPQNCQADCGFCGDGICGYPENCSACVNDCGSTCLSFTLSSELKKSGCAGDDDNDCLDNGQETDLAWLAAPHYFYDENENCSGAPYTDGPSALHYGRRDFVQVRPVGGVTQWSPSSSAQKTVQVTYFLLHPHDCQDYVIAGGHQGDSEHVVFRFRSLNLKKWYLVSGDYYHHNGMHTFSGSYLRQRASEIGTAYPSVAGDEDGHGSWPGESGSKSACAGSEDDCLFGTCDCFRGTMKGAFDAGYRGAVVASRNIGGPSPERWRPSVVGVSGSVAWSQLDVGHGPIYEYWTPRTDSWKKFCGWECPLRYSNTGDCAQEAHGETDCSSPLSEKVDKASFTPPASLAAPLAAAKDLRAGGEAGADAAVVERLRAGITTAVEAVIAPEEGEAFRRKLEDAADPMGALVPTLEGRTRKDQAETLAWMLVVGREKLASALAPGLLAPDLTPQEQELAAAELLGVAASLLEAEGHTAPAIEKP